MKQQPSLPLLAVDQWHRMKADKEKKKEKIWMDDSIEISACLVMPMQEMPHLSHPMRQCAIQHTFYAFVPGTAAAMGHRSILQVHT